MSDWLNEIKARTEAATPGPWRAYPGAYVYVDAYKICQLQDGRIKNPNDEADCEFILAARSDIPLLITRLEAMERAGHSMDCDVRKDSDPSSPPDCSCGWAEWLLNPDVQEEAASG